MGALDNARKNDFNDQNTPQPGKFGQAQNDATQRALGGQYSRGADAGRPGGIQAAVKSIWNDLTNDKSQPERLKAVQQKTGAYQPPAPTAAPTGQPGAAGDLAYQQTPNSVLGTSGSREGKLVGLGGRDSATGRGPNSNFVESDPNSHNGLGDSAYALIQGQKANEIRQSTIDAQNPEKGGGFNKVTVIPDGTEKSPIEALYDKGRKLLDQSQYARNNKERNSLMRQARMYSEQADNMQRGTNADTVANASLENTAADNFADAPLKDARSQEAMARAQAAINGTGDPRSPFTASDFSNMLADGLIPTDEDGLPDQDSPIVQGLMARMDQSYGAGNVKKFEDGGMVEIDGYAEGGPVSAMRTLGQSTPQPQAHPAMIAYQKYASGAQAMGLPPIGFEEFSKLQGGAPQIAGAAGQEPALGFADGGEIPEPDPSVAGKMVIDTDPNAQGDSIPAIIDGEQPAALKSGEFVIPDDVVMFFGTDKLNKMILQARKVEDGGSGSEGAGAGAAATA